jgi:ABC-type multidrug transport system ATPase subunit
VLIAESISKKINSRVVLNNISLKCEAGIYCISGINGVGKSIFLRILSGALKPDSGTVKVDEMDLYLEGAPPRARIGYSPETPQLYEFMTVQEFLSFVANVKKCLVQEYMDILKNLNMLDYTLKYIKTLSNGMKRKVVLTACLMGWPEHLILDEPTNAMDKQAIGFLTEVLRSYQREGKVVIFTTHRQDFGIELSDELYTLENGSLHKS